MNKRFYQKVLAIVIAMGMVLGSSLGVSAAVELGDTGRVESNDTTLTLKKGIVVYNTEGSKVYYPNITYNYALAPVDVTDKTPTVSDDGGDMAYVVDGVTGGLTCATSSLTFDNTATIAAAAAGTEITMPITITADTSKFTKAGIYRYKLTETVETSNLTAASITRPSGYSSERYIDVYITYDSSSGYKVKGYVCFIADGVDKKIDGKTSDNNDNEITAKSSGFVNAYDTDASTGTTTTTTGHADQYYTYNLTVTKTITGTGAETTHPFPFAINTSGVTSQPFSVTTDGSSLSLTTAGAVDSSFKGTTGTEFNVGLANGKNVKLIGLPASSKITKMQETNDTNDTYKAKIDFGSTHVLDETVKAPGATAEIPSAQAISNYSDYSTTGITQTDDDYAVTNTIVDVSPTGLIFRYSPYVLLLGASFLLLLVMGRREKERDEEA